MKDATRSQFTFLLLALVFVWLSIAGNMSLAAGSDSKITPTPQLEQKITAYNISHLREEKVIGQSVNIPGPYAPSGGVNVMFSSKGTYVVSDYNTEGALKIWNVKTGRRVAYLPGQNLRVKQAVFTPDERFVATSDSDGAFRIWSLATFQSKRVDTYAGDFPYDHNIAASPDGRTFAVGNDGNQVTLVDAETGDIKQVLTGKSAPDLFTDFVSFSADGNSLVATASEFLPSEPGTNAILTVWNLKTLQPDVELVGDDCTVKFWASFNSEGTVLVASTSKSYTNACDISEFFNVAPIRTIHIWDVSLRRDVASLDVRRDADERYQPLGFSSDGKFLAVGEQTNDFELYRLTAGSAPEQIAYIKDFLNFRSVFNVDGSLILTMDNLWETETGKNVSPWPKPQDPPFILDTAFSPDGTTIGILMPDSTIQLWRVQ